MSGFTPCAGAPPGVPVAGYRIVVTRVRVGSCGLPFHAGVNRCESTKVAVSTPTAYFGDRGAAAPIALSLAGRSGTDIAKSNAVVAKTTNFTRELITLTPAPLTDLRTRNVSLRRERVGECVSAPMVLTLRV